MRPQGDNDRYALSSDDDDVFQGRTGGVRIGTPERPPGRFSARLPFLGHVVTPERQPIGPPESLLLQQYEGFARFLKSHASPPNKRVTAGGRIVPAGPKSPPPTFHVDFLDKVIQGADEVKRTDCGTIADTTIHEEDNVKWNKKHDSIITNPSELGLNQMSSGPGPFDGSSPEGPGASAPEAVPATGEMNLPAGFKFLHKIDQQSAIATCEGQTFLAVWAANGAISLQSLMQFDAPLQTVPQNTQMQFGHPANHPAQFHQVADLDQGHYPPPPPPLVPIHQGYPVQQMAMQQMNQDFGQGLGLGMSSETLANNAGNQYGFNPGSEQTKYTPEFLKRKKHMGTRGLQPVDPAVRPKHPLLLPASEMDYPTQLHMVGNQHEKMKIQLAQLERFQALHDTTMTNAELERTLERKRRMVVEVDTLRRMREELEQLLQPGHLSLVRKTSSTHMQAAALMQNESGKTRLANPGAKSFVPQRSQTFGRNDEKYYNPSGYGNTKKATFSPDAPAFVPGEHQTFGGVFQENTAFQGTSRRSADIRYTEMNANNQVPLDQSATNNAYNNSQPAPFNMGHNTAMRTQSHFAASRNELTLYNQLNQNKRKTSANFKTGIYGANQNLPMSLQTANSQHSIQDDNSDAYERRTVRNICQNFESQNAEPSNALVIKARMDEALTNLPNAEFRQSSSFPQHLRSRHPSVVTAPFAGGSLAPPPISVYKARSSLAPPTVHASAVIPSPGAPAFTSFPGQCSSVTMAPSMKRLAPMSLRGGAPASMAAFNSFSPIPGSQFAQSGRTNWQLVDDLHRRAVTVNAAQVELRREYERLQGYAP